MNAKLNRSILFLIYALIFASLLTSMMGCAPQATATPEPTAVPAEPTEAPQQKNYVIGMVTIASHPSLDLIQQGVKDRLKEAGFVEGQNLTILAGNAQGDMATMNTIVQQFIDQKVDLIVATTTPAAQTAYKLTQDASGPPVFYNGVSNPFSAGLATSADDHPAWVIGNQLLDPVEQTLKLIQEIVPDAKKIGVVYNPSEANSTYLFDLANDFSKKMGLQLEAASVSNSNEIATAAETLVGRGVQAFLGLNDNTVTSGFEAWVKVANDNQIPLIGTSASMPPLGAAASYGVNPYEEGLDSGDLIVRYLKGEVDIAKTAVMVQDAVVLTVNPGAAQKQGITLPQALIDRADNVVE